MPRLTHKLPSLRLHKPFGQAVVALNGTDHYLGPFDSKASKLPYDRLISEWLASNRQLPTQAPEVITVVELIAACIRR